MELSGITAITALIPGKRFQSDLDSETPAVSMRQVGD